MSPRSQAPAPAPAAGNVAESIGPLLARLRLRQGLSQLHLAELLCSTAGTATVTRHEVSRWERGERVPGPVWLGWLAAALRAPLERLEAAAAAARPGGAGGAPGRRDREPFWRIPTAVGLLAALDHAPGHDLRDLAHNWLAGPAQLPGPAEPGSLVAVRRPVAAPAGADPVDHSRPDALAARLADLRRCDDMVGGLDLAARLDRELRAAVGWLPASGPGRPRRRALRIVAGYAQLAGWASADAGAAGAARRAYRVALRAAATGGDRQLGAYILASLSHLSLTAGDPQEAMLLARTGHAGAATAGSPRLLALLRHRMALAAAQLGERRIAELALAAADRAAGQSGSDEPDYLYWLDPAELAAMTGRCWAVLGRPVRAAELLARPRRLDPGHRTTTLYATWLARSYLAIGEVEEAARTATRALLSAARAGSARAADGIRQLHPLLLRHPDVPLIRRYERLVAGAGDFLPGPALPQRTTGRRASVTG